MEIEIVKNFDIFKLKNDNYFNEYIEIKSKHKDFIVLFQIGEFYEAFFEDATILSNIAGLKAGIRNVVDIGKVLQVGFNIALLNSYILKLINEQYKVCVCNQYLDQNQKNTRKIFRKYTIGTVFEDELLDCYENNYIASVSATNDKLYNFSYCDVSTGKFYKTTDTLKNIKFEINRISPQEFLLKNSLKDKFDDFSQLNVVILDDNYEKFDSDDVIVNYSLDFNKQFQPKIDEPLEYKINSYMFLDEVTRQNLELTRTRNKMKKRGSLLWFLNYTTTPMGVRYLKKILSEPLLNENLIRQRNNAVEELVLNKKKLDKIKSILKDFVDLSRICAKLSNSTITPKELYLVAVNSLKILELKNATSGFKSKLLKTNKLNFENIENFSNLIFSALEENSQINFEEGNFIKDGYNSELDYLRNELNIVQNDIKEYQEYLNQTNKTNKITIKYSRLLGNFIEIPKKSKFKVDDEIKLKQTLTNCTRYTTTKLLELELKLSGLKTKIINLEKALFKELKKELMKFSQILRRFADLISLFDVLVAFALCAIEFNFSKPTFNKTNIRILDGYHPNLAKNKNDVVKNDTELNQGQMIILTGANMSGKSTYLKYNALILILAQIGSFVPASFADLAIVDKIFLRQSATDDIINNNSTFMIEMNDLKNILDNATDNSFVLFDEPAKSTNEKEGGAIALAYFEYCLKHKKTKTIVATHNRKLTFLETNFPTRAINYKIGNEDDNLSINRKITRGVLNLSHALDTAILADLPAEIISNAKNYLN